MLKKTNHNIDRLFKIFEEDKVIMKKFIYIDLWMQKFWEEKKYLLVAFPRWQISRELEYVGVGKDKEEATFDLFERYFYSTNEPKTYRQIWFFLNMSGESVRQIMDWTKESQFTNSIMEKLRHSNFNKKWILTKKY